MPTALRSLLLAATCLLCFPACAAVPLHVFTELAVSPDGREVASVEEDKPLDPARKPVPGLVIRSASGAGPARPVSLPCSGPDCVPSSPTFGPDGQLAFVLKKPGDTRRFVLFADASGHSRQVLAFAGTLEALRFGPGGTLAVLATAGAHKLVGALQAGAPLTGEIGTHEDEQRIATIAGGALAWQSPPNLYVYEYSFRPGAGAPRFVATASPGNGDDQWWVAKLYAFDGGGAKILYAPPISEQIGSPVVSRDGGAVAFIGGIMSDFSSRGGDAYLLKLGGGGAVPVDLTPGFHGSVTALATGCVGGEAGALDASATVGDHAAVLSLGGAGGQLGTLWSGDGTLESGRYATGIVCGGGTAATTIGHWDRAPEIEAGPAGHWRAITSVNAAGHPAEATGRSITWRSDGFDVQGWLLSPIGAAGSPGHANPPSGGGPMIVDVHGGPSAASTPEFLTPDDGVLPLLQAGYRVFLPNPRGSFGQGERFAAANVRDFGYGDLRDILRGIDAVERVAPVDDHRLGLIGYSYGGYMTMWAVTQTNRFAAAVAGAGLADWLSYYGENGIDTWMLPFFHASVYDDPAIYARSSPINFIKQVRTPTFEFVGSADVECPMPQTEEFYHALHTLGVPTEFVVYPGEGHGMETDPRHWADAQRRTVAWFDRYLKPAR